MIALWLFCSRDTIAVRHTCLASHTTLCLDFDYTVSTLRTPDSSSSSILQYADVLNVLGVYVKELRKFLVVGRREVEGTVTVVLPYVSVNYDKWVCITVD